MSEPLIVLEQFLLVPLLQVIRHCVRPLQRHSAPEHFIYGLPHELNFDPRQRGRKLHLFHFLLGLGVQVH